MTTIPMTAQDSKIVGLMIKQKPAIDLHCRCSLTPFQDQNVLDISKIVYTLLQENGNSGLHIWLSINFIWHCQITLST